MIIFPQCFSCRHLTKGKPMRCPAFPDRIPRDILLNKFDHRKPHEGDHDIQFEPKPGESSPFADYEARIRAEQESTGGGPREEGS